MFWYFADADGCETDESCTAVTSSNSRIVMAKLRMKRSRFGRRWWRSEFGAG